MKAIDHGCADACFCEAVEHMVHQAAAIDLNQGLGTVIG
jgi:hypothetical protein